MRKPFAPARLRLELAQLIGVPNAQLGQQLRPRPARGFNQFTAPRHLGLCGGHRALAERELPVYFDQAVGGSFRFILTGS